MIAVDEFGSGSVMVVVTQAADPSGASFLEAAKTDAATGAIASQEGPVVLHVARLVRSRRDSIGEHRQGFVNVSETVSLEPSPLADYPSVWAMSKSYARSHSTSEAPVEHQAVAAPVASPEAEGTVVQAAADWSR